eukprot:403371220
MKKDRHKTVYLKNLILVLSLLLLSKATLAQDFSEFLNPRELQNTCPVKNMFPVFYGGTSNNFVRYMDASSDGKYILMCGESYSQYNFVDRAIEAFVMMVKADDGTYMWGKYYQNSVTNATMYVGLINVCKFTNLSPQKVMVAGQINFYRPFFGFIDMEGDNEIFYQFSSALSEDKVGYTSISLDIDRNGNLYGGVYFMSKAIQIFKLNTKQQIFDWQYQVGNNENAYMSGGNPNSCLDPSATFLYFGGAVAFNDTNQYNISLNSTYFNSSILQVSASTGSLSWFKRNPALNQIGRMECLNNNGGVVGCGAYAATAHVFKIGTNGKAVYTYMFTGDNPESQSSAQSYTNTGFRDAVIVQMELNGRLKKGRFLTLRSQLTLANNLVMFSDGTFAFAGASKRALNMNFQYQAMFLMRINPFQNSKDDFACIGMSSVPDDDAYGYNDDVGAFQDVKNLMNPNIKLYQKQVLKVTAITNITGWNLKAIYKAYQMCFKVSFFNPYETVSGNQTIILSPKEVGINENNTSDPDIVETFSKKPFSYYLGEIGQFKTLTDSFYKKLKQNPMTVTLNTGVVIPNFINYSNDKLSIYTNDTTMIKSYMIMFSGCLNETRSVYYQEVRVLKNTPPFMYLTQLNYTFDIKKNYQVQLPPIQDKERNSEYTVSLFLSDFATLPYFIKLDTRNLIINVRPLSPIDVGSYNLVLKIAETDAPSYYAQYILKLNVKDPNQTVNVPSSEKSLSGKVQDYSTDGSVKIAFNQLIAIPPQTFEQIRDSEFIKLNIQGPFEPYEYTWEVTEITSKYLKLKITFDDPSIIGVYSDKETVDITFNRFLIQTQNEKGNYLSNLKYQAELALVIDQDSEILQSLLGVSTAMKVVLSGVIGSSMLGNTLMSQAMSNLWALLNGLQILTYFVFFNVNLLSHIYIFFDMLMVSHFDVIPFKDTIYQKIEDNDVTFIPINYNFSLYGYDSQLFIMNVADIYMVIMILIGYYAIYKAVQYMFKRSQTPRFKKVQEYVDEQVGEYKYNTIIRFMMESYLDMALFSYMNIVLFYMEDNLNITSGAFAVLFFIISVAIPIVGAVFIYKNSTQLQESKEFLNKYGSIVKGMQSNRVWSRYFFEVFLGRRLYYCLLFAFPPDWVYFQLGLNLVHCVFQLSYNIIVRPFFDFKLNMQEIVNELCILLVACLWFCMTDAVPDITTKNRMGWAIIFIILATLVFNLIIVIIEIIKAIHKKILECKNKRKQKYFDHDAISAQQKDDMKYGRHSPTEGIDRTQNTLAVINLGNETINKSNRLNKKSKNADDLILQDINGEESKFDESIMDMMNHPKEFNSTLTAKSSKIPKKAKKHIAQLPSQDLTGVSPLQESYHQDEFERDNSDLDNEFKQARMNRQKILGNQEFGQKYDPNRIQQNNQVNFRDLQKQYNSSVSPINSNFNAETQKMNFSRNNSDKKNKGFETQPPIQNKVEQEVAKTKKRKIVKSKKREQKQQSILSTQQQEQKLSSQNSYQPQNQNSTQENQDFSSQPFENRTSNTSQNNLKKMKPDIHDDFDELY